MYLIVLAVPLQTSIGLPSHLVAPEFINFNVKFIAVPFKLPFACHNISPVFDNERSSKSSIKMQKS